MFLYNIGYLFNTPHYNTHYVKIELLCKLYTYDSYIREVLVALHKVAKCLACKGSLSYNHEINDWDISIACKHFWAASVHFLTQKNYN